MFTLKKYIKCVYISMKVMDELDRARTEQVLLEEEEMAKGQRRVRPESKKENEEVSKGREGGEVGEGGAKVELEEEHKGEQMRKMQERHVGMAIQDILVEEKDHYRSEIKRGWVGMPSSSIVLIYE
jgi:hypothetical protein